MSNIDLDYPYHTFTYPDGETIPGHWEHSAIINSGILDFDVEGKTLLEAGCCHGFFAAYFAKRGAKVTAIDIAASDRKKMFDYCTKRYGVDLELVQMDAMNINEQYDIIFSSDVICHNTDQIGMARIIREHIREFAIIVFDFSGQGNQVIIDPNNYWYPYIYQRGAIFDLLRVAGFRTIDDLGSFKLTSPLRVYPPRNVAVLRCY